MLNIINIKRAIPDLRASDIKNSKDVFTLLKTSLRSTSENESKNEIWLHCSINIRNGTKLRCTNENSRTAKKGCN